MANGFEPPIPYTGAKRLWAKELIAIANKMPKGAKILDAYGGSGLCSHVFKSTRPDLQVFCNDSDNYHAKWLPHRETVEAWWNRWHDKPASADNQSRATAALGAALGNKELAEQIARNLIDVKAYPYGDSDLMRKSYPADIEGYCRGVHWVKHIWGPLDKIPTTGWALLILDPPYNTVKALDSTYYGTRRDDPPLSLWAAQQAFKGSTPAICWGRDGWLVDYPGGAVLAEKHASRGHNTEWLKGNAAFVKKYGKKL